MEFYLRDSRSNTGDNATFWMKGGGYGTDLSKCDIFTLEDAQKHHNSRASDVPLLKSEVDRLSISAVDCQYLPKEVLKIGKGPYVVQRNGLWNGNDIQFLIRYDGVTFNYSDAGVFSFDEACDLVGGGNFSSFLKSDIDAIRRRTFQARNIHTRNMITDAGISLAKKKRTRKTTGKHRHNCPGCAKFVWDFNPYDAPYCSRICEILN